MGNRLKKSVIAWMEKVLPYTFYRYIIFLCKKVKFMGKEWPYWEEYFLKWRPFSKEKYYIIRLDFPSFAYFSAAREYILAGEYVKQKGMHPIMALIWGDEMRNGYLYGINEWDTIFRQQKIKDIAARNATILVSRLNNPAILDGIAFDDIRINATENNWKVYYKNAHKYVKKYWKFNRYIIDEINRQYEKMFLPEEHVLGVSLRENFTEEYQALIKNRDAKQIYSQHPLGPNVDEILCLVEEYLQTWNCDKIFVATFYRDSVEKFEKRFPSRVVYCERERVTMAENAEATNSRRLFFDHDAFRDLEYRGRQHIVAREYAQETILLSKCTYFIGAKSGQTIAALSLNGGRYKDIKILYDKNNVKNY